MLFPSHQGLVTAVEPDPCIVAKNAPDAIVSKMPRTVGETFFISSTIRRFELHANPDTQVVHYTSICFACPLPLLTERCNTGANAWEELNAT